MIKAIILSMIVFASPALAAEVPLSGAEITTALTDKAVTGVDEHGNGYVQTFWKDGSTFYSQGRSIAKGYWNVRGDQYCSAWPPSEDWACYRMTSEGDSLTFIGDDGKIWLTKVAR